MRDFTKSMVSAGMAGAFFGAKQLTNVVSKPPRTGESDNATESFNAMAQAAIAQCDGPLRETFHAMDRIQREAIDTGWRFIRLDAFNSNGAADSFAAFAQEATSRVRGWMAGGDCGCQRNQCNGDCGPQAQPSDNGTWRTNQSHTNQPVN